MHKIDAPCKGCQKRDEDCHSACAAYIVYRMYMDRRIAQRAREAAENPEYMPNSARVKRIRERIPAQKRGRKW